MTKGFFISFEGCEGCGKSTLCTYINSELGKRGYISTLTREPGGTIIGEKIRSLLLHDHTVGALSDHTELLLFLASRAEHVAQVIQPALDRGEIIISDRYIDSTIAYQAYGRKKDPHKIAALCKQAVSLLPDYTICLDISYEVACARITKRQGSSADKIEKEADDFHKRVRYGFMELAQQDTKRITMLDAHKPFSELAQIALDCVIQKIEQKK